MKMHSYILTSDIGGTNTSIALVQHERGRFTLVAREVYPTQKLQNFSEAMRLALESFSRTVDTGSISAACLAIAGHVKNNRCFPSNIPWTLNGADVEEEFGFKALLINDFTALCYGISLLDVKNPEKITPMPQPDGFLPSQQNHLPDIGIKAVVGAGTGLGLGYLIEEGDRVLALPAEGGHADFAPHNETARKLAHYLQKNPEIPVNTESLVSGNGIVNIFNFVNDEMATGSDIVHQISALDDSEKPAAISHNAHNDETCKAAIHCFVELYARVAHNVALSYIPRNGLFLAGGIAAKNREFLLEDNRFMKAFLMNGSAPIQPLLKDIPVYIVEDYRTSLYGAAYAFVHAYL